MEYILDIELKVHPRTSIRNYSRRIKYLSTNVRFSLIVRKKCARRTMHLTNNYPLNTVYHKRSGRAHHRHLTEKYFLLLDLPNRINCNLGYLIGRQNLKNILSNRRFCRDESFCGLRTLNLLDNDLILQVLHVLRGDINHFPIKKNKTDHYLDGIRIGKTLLPTFAKLMLFLIGNFLFTVRAYYSGTTKLLKFTTTTLPNTNLKTHILYTGINV